MEENNKRNTTQGRSRGEGRTRRRWEEDAESRTVSRVSKRGEGERKG